MLTENTEDLPEARILVLDDEEPQRMTIHLQLAGLGRFQDFSDPREAIAYLREHHHVDAAVVDIRMPNMPVDGLWFLRELREFDRELGVILRTADDDIAIAQAGIEARAIQRVIKAQPNAKQTLRTAVQTAIGETRERRRLNTMASRAEGNHRQLVTALGRIDEELTVSEMCRGFVQGLVNQLTALSGYSELFVQHAAQQIPADDRLATLANKNRVAASRMTKQVEDFLNNPYVEALVSPPAHACANACIDALRKSFLNHPLLGQGKCNFTGRGCLPDVAFSARPAHILTALRHMVEYCAVRSPASGTVALTVEQTSDAVGLLAANKRGLVLNGRWASRRPTLVFSVRGEFEPPSNEDIRRDLRLPAGELAAVRTGCLFMVANAVLDDHLVMDVARAGGPKGGTVFNLYVPVSTA